MFAQLSTLQFTERSRLPLKLQPNLARQLTLLRGADLDKRVHAGQPGSLVADFALDSVHETSPDNSPNFQGE